MPNIKRRVCLKVYIRSMVHWMDLKALEDKNTPFYEVPLDIEDELNANSINEETRSGSEFILDDERNTNDSSWLEG